MKKVLFFILFLFFLSCTGELTVNELEQQTETKTNRYIMVCTKVKKRECRRVYRAGIPMEMRCYNVWVTKCSPCENCQ